MREKQETQEKQEMQEKEVSEVDTGRNESVIISLPEESSQPEDSRTAELSI